MNLPRTEHRARPTATVKIQINTSPASGEIDFSPLARHERNISVVDKVSVADVFRNAFVYPPHTIYADVKIAATGFDPAQDMYDDPQFHFAFHSARATARPRSEDVEDDVLIDTYHRLLCQAITRATRGMHAPWLLQSGGKDSTSMAIALAEARPDTTCLTYLGGKEEDEVASAHFVAQHLGLRHEVLVCDPGRAYDRYLAMLPRLPLLCADFAALSYADLATEVARHQGDGILDAQCADQYFGVPLRRQDRIMSMLARGLRVPPGLFRLASTNFPLCVALSTLQMDRFERNFPGSRFSDSEVDDLFGDPIAAQSRQRMQVFQADIAAAVTPEAQRRLAVAIGESSNLGKGMYAARAMSLRLAYPYADPQFRDWVFHQVPDDRLIGPGGVSKVLMRQYIAECFEQLPYVKAKGSFRFDLCGLAKLRFDQVYAYAQEVKALLPGATRWLDAHRKLMDNKFFASKFYLLAIVLPWLLSHTSGRANR
ncbi:asparagine synthase-related protein [Dyella sp.]|uniref:asparagine synthase-related protein n=1 Tax=Dyella sp. TaxID=1869338 RepID=UPI002B46313D|nr:asparagine synthase-related protein [Dyella sp.]HKT29564.1 asparagine synthase-related protein [Dyella sp.]